MEMVLAKEAKRIAEDMQLRDLKVIGENSRLKITSSF